MKFDKNTIYFIKCYDHFSVSNVKDFRDLKPTITFVVGFYVDEDDKYIYLSPFVVSDTVNSEFDVYAILKSTIISKRVLRV